MPTRKRRGDSTPAQSLNAAHPCRVVAAWFVLTMAEGDPSPGQVVWGEFDNHPVARQHADVVLPHATTEVTEHFVAILEFDLEHGVRKGFHHATFDGDGVRIRPARTFRRCRGWRGDASWCWLASL